VLALLNYDHLKLIDKQNKMLQTPLMNAASKGNTDIVALLLASGADTTKKVRAWSSFGCFIFIVISFNWDCVLCRCIV
jgi:ankyrin repeat protein